MEKRKDMTTQSTEEFPWYPPNLYYLTPPSPLSSSSVASCTMLPLSHHPPPLPPPYPSNFLPYPPPSQTFDTMNSTLPSYPYFPPAPPPLTSWYPSHRLSPSSFNHYSPDLRYPLPYHPPPPSSTQIPLSHRPSTSASSIHLEPLIIDPILSNPPQSSSALPAQMISPTSEPQNLQTKKFVNPSMNSKASLMDFSLEEIENLLTLFDLSCVDGGRDSSSNEGKERVGEVDDDEEDSCNQKGSKDLDSQSNELLPEINQNHTRKRKDSANMKGKLKKSSKKSKKNEKNKIESLALVLNLASKYGNYFAYGRNAGIRQFDECMKSICFPDCIVEFTVCNPEDPQGINHFGNFKTVSMGLVEWMEFSKGVQTMVPDGIMSIRETNVSFNDEEYQFNYDKSLTSHQLQLNKKSKSEKRKSSFPELSKETLFQANEEVVFMISFHFVGTKICKDAKFIKCDKDEKLVEIGSPSQKINEQRQEKHFEKIECYGSVIFRRKWNSKVHKVELIYEYTK